MAVRCGCNVEDGPAPVMTRRVFNQAGSQVDNNGSCTHASTGATRLGYKPDRFCLFLPSSPTIHHSVPR